jgi:23S rRNA (pseudouridine1915-N3)-methyltransferase
MKIVLIQVGKTSSKYLVEGIQHYNSRTSRMVNFETITIPDIKNRGALTQAEQKKIEGARIIEKISAGDLTILLDERGEQYDSIKFAEYIESLMINGLKRLNFVIGGPYGFSEEVYERAGKKVSLSRMTFSHQMVRLLFAEQLFRSFTLIKGIPYHNE